jgi:hypothetical protein
LDERVVRKVDAYPVGVVNISMVEFLIQNSDFNARPGDRLAKVISVSSVA